MHIQNQRARRKFNAFLDRKWVRRISYLFAILFVLAIVLLSIEKREFPNFMAIVIVVVSIGYILSDLKMMKNKKTQDNKR